MIKNLKKWLDFFLKQGIIWLKIIKSVKKERGKMEKSFGEIEIVEAEIIDNRKMKNTTDVTVAKKQIMKI